MALGEIFFNTCMSACIVRYKKTFYQDIKIVLEKGKFDQMQLLNSQNPEIINLTWRGH